MPSIERIHGMEILDSRGRPTVKAWCELSSGATGAASVPSGASTGRSEAHELRDGGGRYGGLGCRVAAANLETVVDAELRGTNVSCQADFDHALVALDATPDKHRLGANTLLAASLAFARARAAHDHVALFEHLADGGPGRLPRLTINLLSGGRHAGGQVAIQDVLIVPATPTTVDDSLAMADAVYRAAVAVTAEEYRFRELVADEGGLAPPFTTPEAMLETAIASIRRAGLQPGHDVMLAIDLAASHFHHEGSYFLDGPDATALTPVEMIERIDRWVDEYHVCSVEDGLDEDDWEHWPRLTEQIGARALVLGDDLLTTNPGRVERAVDTAAANALLVKVNQIGTLTEALAAASLADDAGWATTVSARSGETEDDWLADLAVAWRGDQMKVGSIRRSERLAKYNRLLEIEARSGFDLNPWPLA